ncbi:MAG: hypothetical protein WDN04_10590 [Rhodospirillales bacterium]
MKGTGWYATDFKGGGKPASTTATSGSEAKTDAKPDAQTRGKDRNQVRVGGARGLRRFLRLPLNRRPGAPVRT